MRWNKVSLVLAVLMIITCGTTLAFASTLTTERSADDRIFIYDQGEFGEHSQGYDLEIVFDQYSNRTTMAEAGDSLYATLHAYQWVTGDARTTSNAAALIGEFLNCDGEASMMVEDAQNGNSYTNYLQNKYNVIVETPVMSESTLTSFFNRGGALKMSTPNGTHYVTAVGAVKADYNNDGISETWIHVVDSAAYRTFDPSAENITGCRTFTSYTPLTKSFLDSRNSAMWYTDDRTEDNYAALEYWVPYSSFSKFGIIVGYLPVSTINSSTSAASTLQFANVVYPKVYKINADGWPLSSGVLTSNVDLKTIRSQLCSSSGVISDSGILNISGKSYAIKYLDSISVNGKDNGVRFSQITTAGDYEWVLTATDSAGRSLTLRMPFTAVVSGSTVTSIKSAQYSDDVLVSSIALNHNFLSLTDGDTRTLSATVSPSNAANSAVAWESNDTEIATVSDDGTVTAISSGEAIITCYALDGSGVSASCHVTIGATWGYCPYCEDYLTGEYVGVNDWHQFECSNCGELSNELEGHIGLCTDKRTCLDCGVETDYDIAYYHCADDFLTCVPHQYDHAYICSDCGEAVAYYAHSAESCLSPYCDDCGIRTTSLDMHHNFNYDLAPKCLDSKLHYWICIDCGDREYGEHDYSESTTCECGAEGEPEETCEYWDMKYTPDPKNKDRHIATCSECDKVLGYGLHENVCDFGDSRLQCDLCGANWSKITHFNGPAICDPNNSKLHIVTCDSCGEELYSEAHYYYCGDARGICYACGAKCNVANIEHVYPDSEEHPAQVNPDDYSTHIIRCWECNEIMDYEKHSYWYELENDTWYCEYCCAVLYGDYETDCTDSHSDGENVYYFRSDPNNPLKHYGYCSECGEKIYGNHVAYCYAPYYCQICESSCEKVPVTHKYADGACIYCGIDSLSGIALNQTLLEWDAGNKSPISLTASPIPSDAQLGILDWNTSDSSVASVTNGKVTPVGAGVAWIECVDSSGVSTRIRVVVHSSDAVSMPSDLKRIEEEAFTNLSMKEVVLNDGVQFIGSKAFAYCWDLIIINMPDSVTEIADDAFELSNDVVFVCASDNTAADYAKTNGIPYIVK